MGTSDSGSWSLFFGTDEELDDSDPLIARARSSATFRLRVRETASLPYFLDQDGNSHELVNAFFSSARMRSKASLTNERYARTIRLWLNFLHLRGLSLSDAGERDLFDFKFWRRTDLDNPRRVAGSSWNGDLAAITALARWAHDYRGLPMPRRYEARETSTAFVGTRSYLGGSTARQSAVKWLTPAAYRNWRDIGVLGKDAVGSEQLRWRPRCEVRDAAFCDGLYGSGLRLQEWASVLVVEIRDTAEGRNFATHDLADGCAKGLRGHRYWLRREVLEGVMNYVEGPRNASIRRARESGAYLNLHGARFVREIRADNQLTLEGRDGRLSKARLNELTPAERRLLLEETPDGLAPLALWLNENGLPRPRASWHETFTRANLRVQRAGVDRLRCSPHMLRHSFALRWFAVGRLAWGPLGSASGSEYSRDLQAQFGDTWSLVQTMLGHSDVETTRRIYLEPFQHLDVQTLLEHGSGDLAAETMLQVLRENPRVRFGIAAEERP